MRPGRFEVPEVAPRIRIDLTEPDASHAAKAGIPGLRNEDIDVRVGGNPGTRGAELKSEREEKKDGILELKLPRQAEASTRRITIQ